MKLNIVVLGVHSARVQNDPFPAFHPRNDIVVGHFAAMSMMYDDILA
jgi:hypothetical protein